jgi:hypothetical protein
MHKNKDHKANLRPVSSQLESYVWFLQILYVKMQASTIYEGWVNLKG